VEWGQGTTSGSVKSLLADVHNRQSYWQCTHPDSGSVDTGLVDTVVHCGSHMATHSNTAHMCCTTGVVSTCCEGLSRSLRGSVAPEDNVIAISFLSLHQICSR